MKRRLSPVIALVLLITMILPRAGHAEFEDIPVGSRPIGMGSAFTAAADDCNAISWNPAGLVKINDLEVTSMHTKLYDMSELSMDHFGVARKIDMLKGVLGFSYLKMGSELYNEKTYTFSFSRELTENHSFGINLKQMESQIWDTPDRTALGIDVGLMMKLTDIIDFGAFVRNLNNPTVNENLPMSYRVGIAARPIDTLLLSLDMEQQTESNNQHTSWHIGQELNISPNFVLRAGYSSYPKSLHAGFGFNMMNWFVDYAYKDHQVLDSTHRVSATFKFDTGKIFTRPKKKYEKNEDIDVNLLELDADKIMKTDKISINKATSKDLMKVPGISKSLSNNIVLFRHIHGKYKSLRDLMKVPSFSTEIYDLTKNLLTL